MWLRTHYMLKNQQRYPDHISGEHRAAIELAAAMQDALDIQDTNPSSLREQQLKGRIEKELKGGAIMYANANAKVEMQAYSIKKSVRAWFKREKWGFSAIVFTCILSATMFTVIMFYILGTTDFRFWVWFWISCFSLLLGQVWAICVGTTNRSRILIILFWTTVTAVMASIFVHVWWHLKWL